MTATPWTEFVQPGKSPRVERLRVVQLASKLIMAILLLFQPVIVVRLTVSGNHGETPVPARCTMSRIPSPPHQVINNKKLPLFFFYRPNLTRFYCIEEQLTVPLGLLSIQFCKGSDCLIKGV